MARICNFQFEKPVHSLGQYKAWKLSHFAAAVDMAWVSIARARNPSIHRLLPHAEPSLAIRRRRDGEGRLLDIELTICGPFHESALYAPEPREELIAVRLKPETSADLFGVSPIEYSENPPCGAPEQLQVACSSTLMAAETKNPIQIAQSLIMDLQNYATNKRNIDKPEIQAAELIRRTGGRVRCADLAKSLDVSDRHLRRRFRVRLGCSPKDYARQLRLTATMQRAEKEQYPDWAAIAADSGFHDQAHMINDFQSLINLTPHALHQERRALSAAS